jgi:GT2 family glycosyltransferase
VRVVEVDLSEPLPDLERGPGRFGIDYASARVLVRASGTPMGTISVDLSRGPVPAADLRSAIAHEIPDACGDTSGSAAHVPAARPGAAGTHDDAVARRIAPVTVVIATCRRPELLADCLASLLASDHPDFEIVIADNDPDDPRTLAVARACSSRDDRVHYCAEVKRGTSHARNTGVVHASGELIAFTDDDVVVDREWLRTITAPLDEDPSLSCVTGLTQPYELETAAQWWFELYGGMSNGYIRQQYSLDMDEPPTLLFPFTPGVGGSNNMAVRRSVLARLHGFDVRLGPGTPTAGGEDLDLFVRILLAHGRILYEPRAVVWHRHRDDEAALHRHVSGYGTGSVAVLTKWFMRRPDLRRKVARNVLRLPAAFGPRGRRGERVVAPPPPSLARAQVAGGMLGPVRWLQSWATARMANVP